MPAWSDKLASETAALTLTTKGVASTPKTELQRCMNNENTMNLHSEPKQMEAKTANKSLL